MSKEKYYVTLDTETTNDLDYPLVYDLGFAFHNRKGKVVAKFSFVIYEVFFGMKDLMKEAFYAEKIPQYLEQIKRGERKVVTFYTARKIFHEECKKWGVDTAIAHNMRFDYNALTTTQRYLTKSKYRSFFPFGMKLWDTMRMANDTIAKQKGYISFCEENGYLTKTGRVQTKAETLYKYISGKYDFEESHTGLEDVMIEKEIFVHCMRQHKKMTKKCFKDKPIPPMCEIVFKWK